MRLRLTVSFCIVAMLIAADATIAIWAIGLARVLFPGPLEPLAISFVSVVALGLGGYIVAACQSMLAAWVSNALPHKVDVF